MTTRNLLVGALALLTGAAGCQQEPPKKEAWQKREQVYTDHPPEHWIELIQHRNPRVREKAAPMVVQYGKSQVLALVGILEKTKSGGVRLSVVRALQGLGPDAEAAVPVLCRLLRDSQWSERDVAADALAAIGRPQAQIVAALADALEDPDDRVRGRAARALGRLGTSDPAVVSALAAVLEDGNADVQAEAAEALQHIGSDAQAAVPALEKAAQSENFIVAQAAQEALKAVRGR
jgi:HEAT repeat protein